MALASFLWDVICIVSCQSHVHSRRSSSKLLRTSLRSVSCSQTNSSVLCAPESFQCSNVQRHRDTANRSASVRYHPHRRLVIQSSVYFIVFNTRQCILVEVVFRHASYFLLVVWSGFVIAACLVVVPLASSRLPLYLSVIFLLATASGCD